MHVMLIEDDPLVRETVMDSLSAEGMTVEGLASAEDALVLLGAGQMPDVIVADVNLGGGLTGTGLAAIARERHPEVALVVISGLPDARPTSADRFARRGEHFLAKPFTPQALSRAIRDAVRDAAVATAAD